VPARAVSRDVHEDDEPQQQGHATAADTAQSIGHVPADRRSHPILPGLVRDEWADDWQADAGQGRSPGCGEALEWIACVDLQ